LIPVPPGRRQESGPLDFWIGAKIFNPVNPRVKPFLHASGIPLYPGSGAGKDFFRRKKKKREITVG
jgi:hypothetical protein